MKKLLAIALVFAAALALAACGGRGGVDEERLVEDLYQEAIDSMGRGNYEMAVERFEQLVARYPFGVHALQAQLMIIYGHYRAGQPESAVAAADRFMRMHPRDENVAYALYMRGVARESMDGGGPGRLFNVNQVLRDPEPRRRAFLDYRELVERFPDSEYVEDARQRMDALREHLAAYELYITDFYLERRAYLAAANRARTVLADYPGTEAVNGAMERLAAAYRGLGLDGLGDEVLQEMDRLREAPPAIFEAARE